ncbi:hypothetical protein KSX_59330 [Ktedonospora formicarum]|uniref:Uncharacterized protein n=1 Tax=Ktedonospora formicarum TaxID=2778364 RepID=A0A8J3MU26_9CHLR|nr:hypothetical protein KSX_59330 [Ktedonospora formicarum]
MLDYPVELAIDHNVFPTDRVALPFSSYLRLPQKILPPSQNLSHVDCIKNRILAYNEKYGY